ncbi:MAG: UDP-glucose 4-epimerase GalE [Anaerolineales bacterium]|jgi:UDP-glucose 4-epimerase
MRIFLTGGAGYIGSACAQLLVEAGHQVTVYDALITGHQAAVPPGARLVRGNLEEVGKLQLLLQEGQFEGVMHFAGSIEAGESMRQPGKYFTNNLGNSIRLIEAACQAGIGRLVFSSTAAVYASSTESLREDSPLGPSNVYGQSKLMTEQVLQWYSRTQGLHYAALRYFNAAGALPGRGEDHPGESHLIPLVLRVALGQSEYAQVFGNDYPTPDGTAIRDYIHIEDLISAHLLALNALAKENQLVYNLGNGQGYSVREVVEAARRVTGHAIPTADYPRRPGDAPRLVASSEKARRELGWRPQHPSIEEIIASAWEWHHSHPLGYAGG